MFPCAAASLGIAIASRPKDVPITTSGVTISRRSGRAMGPNTVCATRATVRPDSVVLDSGAGSGDVLSVSRFRRTSRVSRMAAMFSPTIAVTTGRLQVRPAASMST
jgi:hypothetical protein